MTGTVDSAPRSGVPADANSAKAEPAPPGAPPESEGVAAPIPPPRWAFWMRLPPEVVTLTLLALTIRLVYLGNPRAIVFDEVYFRDYALRYGDGSYYFDLHPPLGKLLLAGWAWLIGEDAAAESADAAVGLRILPALAGCALIVVFYFFLRRLSGSRPVATLGAALLLLENALLVESRFILIDSMLLLFGFGALTVYLISRDRAGPAHWWLHAAAATLAGCAAATKLTGLTALGVIGLTWAFTTLRDRLPWRRFAPELGLLAVVPAMVYGASFAVHFSLLPNSGPGDAFMSARFQSTLVGNPNYDAEARMSIPARVVELNDAIRRYEHSLNDATHSYSSSWTSWPVMHRGVYYHAGDAAADGKKRYIYLLGNPVVWWGVLAGAAATAIGWVRRPAAFARYRNVLAFLAVAWALAYLPFAAIERPMFLYHYFFPLMFSLAAAAIGVGVLAGWLPAARLSARSHRASWDLPRGRPAWLFWGILIVAAAGFAWFAPLSYGFPLTDAELSRRIWFDSWR